MRRILSTSGEIAAGPAAAPRGRDQYLRGFSVPNFTKHPLSVESRWSSGSTDTATFELDQLLATKMRALYQRRNCRGLLNMAMGLADRRSNAGRIEDMFRKNIDREDGPVIPAMFERNLAGRLGDTQFNADMSALLRSGFGWCLQEAALTVSEKLISLRPGEPSKAETEA